MASRAHPYRAAPSYLLDKGTSIDCSLLHAGAGQFPGLDGIEGLRKLVDCFGDEYKPIWITEYGGYHVGQTVTLGVQVRARRRADTGSVTSVRSREPSVSFAIAVGPHSRSRHHRIVTQTSMRRYHVKTA